MKRYVAFAYVAAAVFWSAAGQATPVCTGGTLLSALDGGCTISDKLFADFTATVGGNDVSSSLSLASIDNGDLLGVGFFLGLPVALPDHLSVSANTPLSIGYSVRVLDPLFAITDIHLGLTGSTTGLVTETVTSGVNLLATRFVGTNPAGVSFGNTADAIFEGVDTIAVLKEITNIDVFTGGNTIRQEVSQTPVPEPASLLIFAAALLGMAVVKRKQT